MITLPSATTHSRMIANKIKLAKNVRLIVLSVIFLISSSDRHQVNAVCWKEVDEFNNSKTVCRALKGPAIAGIVVGALICVCGGLLFIPVLRRRSQMSKSSYPNLSINPPPPFPPTTSHTSAGFPMGGEQTAYPPPAYPPQFNHPTIDQNTPPNYEAPPEKSQHDPSLAQMPPPPHDSSKNV